MNDPWLTRLGIGQRRPATLFPLKPVPKPAPVVKAKKVRQPGHIRPASKALGDDVTLSRFVKVGGGGSKPKRQGPLPGVGHPVVERGRSLFFRKGTRPVDDKPVLVSGHNSAKIGRDVRKGHLRGAYIYSLSLEERATCPRTCHHWYDCYGNGMPFAKRVDHRDKLKLEAAIERDIIRYTAKGRRIVIRLHVLGDFYDEQYVEFWGNMLAKYDLVTIYGYTAYDPSTPIGGTIMDIKNAFGMRFAIRWSGHAGRWGAMDIRKAADVPEGAFICPEQTGKTKACATCALCWSTDKAVAFLDH